MALVDSRVVAYDVLMFLSILLLVLALVPPFCSRNIVRRKTWHTLMLSMLVFAIGEILLVGQQAINQTPNPELCLVQVAINQATPPFAGAAMAAYTADIYISIRRMFMSDDWEDGPEPENVVVLVLTPWIIFFLIFLEAILVVGWPKPSPTMSQPAFYCRTDNVAVIAVSVAVVLFSCLVAIGCQAATGQILYRNWIRVQKISVTSTVRKYIHAFIRTLAFTMVAVAGITLALVVLAVKKTTPVYSILIPFVPIASTAIFGTYKDIMSFYMFWR